MKINDILDNLGDLKLFIYDRDQKEALGCAIELITYARDNDLIRDKKENPSKVILTEDSLKVVNDLMESVDRKNKNDIDILIELKKITGLLEHMRWCDRKYNGVKPTDDDLK